MSATLGGLIKDLRLQKNISQLEIAFALGWKEPSRLSRIEQGRVSRPPREILDRLMEALRLSEDEKNQLLVVGTYLPTLDEVEEVRKKIKPIVESWPYPAACLDYIWRIIYTNQKMYKACGISPKEQQQIEEKLPWVFEEVFKSSYSLNKAETADKIEERKQYLIRVLTHFQYEQRMRTREKWYQDLVRRMMDNELFRELWPRAQRQMSNKPDVLNFGYKEVKSDIETLLKFYFFSVPVFRDPRFSVELYVPKDIETFQHYQNKK